MGSRDTKGHKSGSGVSFQSWVATRRSSSSVSWLRAASASPSIQARNRMRIFLVCSTQDNWMRGGYGVSLLASGHPKLLVSFVEFMKKPNQRFIVDESTIELRDAEGKQHELPSSGPTRFVKDADGVFRVVVPVLPQGVPAGSYRLRVTLRSEEGLQASSEQEITVR